MNGLAVDEAIRVAVEEAVDAAAVVAVERREGVRVVFVVSAGWVDLEMGVEGLLVVLAVVWLEDMVCWGVVTLAFPGGGSCSG